MEEKRMNETDELKKTYEDLKKDYDAVQEGFLKMYQIITGDTQAMIYLYDFARKCVYVNQRAARMLGISQKTEFEKDCPLLNAVEKKDRKKILQMHKQIETGTQQESKEIVTLKHLNGMKVVYEYRLYALGENEENKVSVCMGILKDVTERYIKDEREKQYTRIMTEKVPLVITYEQKMDRMTLKVKDREDIGQNTYFWSKMIKDGKVCNKEDIPKLLKFLKEGTQETIQIKLYNNMTEEYRWYALTGKVEDNVLSGEALDITELKRKEQKAEYLEKILACLNKTYTMIVQADVQEDTYELLLADESVWEGKVPKIGKYTELEKQLFQNPAMKTEKKVLEYDKEGMPYKILLTSSFHEEMYGKEHEFAGNIKAKALIVEDFAVNAEYTMDILGKAGVEAEWAKNAEEALRSVQDHEKGYFNFVLMDTKMPKKDGYETAREIRQISETLPIIGLSVTDDEIHAQRAKEAGMEENMQKPINLSQAVYLLKKYATFTNIM